MIPARALAFLLSLPSPVVAGSGPGAQDRVPLYVPVDLGVLPGWTRSAATDVNETGQVCGILESDSTTMGFLWLPRPDFGLPAGMSELGSFSPGTLAFSWAAAITDCGQIVGSSLDGDRMRGFLWQAGVMRDVGTLQGVTDADVWLFDVNQRGTFVGHSLLPGTPVPPVPSRSHALLGASRCGSLRSSTLLDIGSPSTDYAFASRVSERGLVVGSFRPSPSGVALRGFVHDPTRGFVELPLASGTDYSTALGVNELGTVTGSIARLDPLRGPLNERAALWRRVPRGWELADLGTFDGMFASFATGVDEQGRVFGVSTSSSRDPLLRPWVWIDGTFHDLNDRLVPDEPVQVQYTGGMNRRGDIAATGTTALGERHAFLLVRIR